MSIGTSITRAIIIGGGTLLPLMCSPTVAMPVVVTLDADFSQIAKTFSFDNVSFTFSGTSDIFNPAAIRTGTGGAVRAFGGFLGIPISPSTDFPNRGSGILTYGPGTQFASFPITTTIPYSNGDNYLGLEVTQGGKNFYGYAFTTDTTLNSFAFETTPNTAISIDTNATAVPELASWTMFIGGFGLIGATARRRRTSISFA